MIQGQNYLRVAMENETVFRNILRDLKKNRKERPMGVYIDVELETEIGVEEIYTKYSAGNRMGVFTIDNFEVDGNVTLFSFKNMATLSGGGAVLKYKVNEDQTVEYLEPLCTVMS